MAVQQVSDAEEAAAAASFETGSMEPILPADAKDEEEEPGQVDLQDSLQSTSMLTVLSRPLSVKSEYSLIPSSNT